MKPFTVCLMSLLALVSVSTAEEPMVLGQVRLSDRSPVAGAQVMLFDMADLRRDALVQATTDADGQFALPLPSLGGSGLPTGFALGPNYPNPFNPSTVIPYQLPADTHVRLEVFNLLGQRVATLVDGAQSAGMHTAMWTATDASGRAVSAGVYLYRLKAAGATASGRMVLVDGQAGVVASGPGRLTGEGATDMGERVYGLAVSGSGLIPYVDTEFAVGAGPLTIEVEVQGRGKVVQEDNSGLLGDVDNDGQVNLIDALLVAMYIANPASVMPNGGDIALGDVNSDGVLNLIDAWLIATYAYNPSAAGLPEGIGEPIQEPLSEPVDDFDAPPAGQEQAFSLPVQEGQDTISMEFVWIEQGTFMMGGVYEKPVHEVEISQGFYLGKYEITQGQWEAVMGETPWSGRNRQYVQSNPSHPASYISWFDVQAFIHLLNEAAGDSLYRLPSEAEWEYACRAGTTTPWSFGDDESQLGDYAWHNGNIWEVNEVYPHAVGTKLPNPWGLYDMHGNVAEWVQDWYYDRYYENSPRVDPQGPEYASYRVIRGGSFMSIADDMRSAYRAKSRWHGDTERHYSIGARLLRIR